MYPYPTNKHMEKKKMKPDDKINNWDGNTYVNKGGKVNRQDKKKITHVVVADSVSKIENHAFQQCSTLESVEFLSSSSLIEIGNCAFFECISSKIYIPSTIGTKNWKKGLLVLRGVDITNF